MLTSIDVFALFSRSSFIYGLFLGGAVRFYALAFLVLLSVDAAAVYTSSCLSPCYGRLRLIGDEVSHFNHRLVRSDSFEI